MPCCSSEICYNLKICYNLPIILSLPDPPSPPPYVLTLRDIIEVLKQQGGYSRVFDMTGEEANKKYFEGTGVLLIDRINGVVYVNVSVSVRKWGGQFCQSMPCPWHPVAL